MLILVRLLPLVLITACSDRQMLDLTLYVEQIKARPASSINPPPVPPAINAFEYIAGERRDPFAPQLALLESEESINGGNPAAQPDLQRRQETLESYPLDSLRMVGTLSRDGKQWALIRSQDDVIHRVSVGSHMGQHHGRVVAIQERRITLVELIQVSNGFREKRVTISLGN